MRLFLTTFLALVSPLLHASAIPLEHFIKHGDYLEMKLSPNGEHILARVQARDRVALIFIRTSDQKIVGGIKSRPKDSIHTANWVNNERIVYEFAEKHVYSDSPIPTGELYATNIDGTRANLLYGYRASDAQTGSKIKTKTSIKASQEILSLLPEDKKHILIIEYPWTQDGNYLYDRRIKNPYISRLNVYSGKKRKLETLPQQSSYALADKKGSIHFMGWVDDNDQLKTAYRVDHKSPWQSLDTVFNLNRWAKPVAVSNDSKKVYFKDTSNDNSLESIYEINLQTKEKSIVFDSLAADVEHWIPDSLTGAPVVGISYPGQHAYHYTKTKSVTAVQHKMLAKAFGGQHVDITSTSNDNKLLLVHVKSSINPGEYYIFNTETKGAKFIWANRSWIDPNQMQPKQVFTIEARDGLDIQGYLTMPKMKEGEEAPMVVLPHGGPNYRDFPDFDSKVQLLANRGFAVLQVNFRGSTGFGKRFLNKGNKQWGGNIINDIVDATQWAINKHKINPKRLCIFGGSFGGYAALMTAAREPLLFKCSIGYNAPYNLNYLFTKGDIPKFGWANAFLERVIGKDSQRLANFSPINHVDKIITPVLLIQGDKDIRVPLIHAKEMEKALKNAGKEVDLIRFSMASYSGPYDLENQSKLYKILLEFLYKHIGNPSISM